MKYFMGNDSDIHVVTPLAVSLGGLASKVDHHPYEMTTTKKDQSLEPLGRVD